MLPDHPKLGNELPRSKLTGYRDGTYVFFIRIKMRGIAQITFDSLCSLSAGSSALLRITFDSLSSLSASLSTNGFASKAKSH